MAVIKDGFSATYDVQGFYAHYDFLLFGKKIEIKDSRIAKIIDEFSGNEAAITELIDKSFLGEDMKSAYELYYKDKLKRLRMEWSG